ncbi:YihY family inner membrane protein [Endozoicomonas ascidiicola]|uniref:YihY family inner membrane protein n=1 Tax=Endozoicomonas ascidiicola TaxID=1698521 RepID=UPI00083611C2|nr:YihY family inner membrane protein [Endozoicomonas ascidiicola]
MAPAVNIWSTFQSFVAELGRRFIEHRCLENAAALTYTTLFAVVPLMTVTYSILSAVPDLQDVGDTIQNFIFESFVPSTGEVVQSYLNEFSQQARKLTGVGVMFLLVTSFLMLRTIDKALNNIWQVSHVRRGISGFLLYWAILSLGPLLLTAGLLATSYLASIKLVSDTTAIIGGEQWMLRLIPIFLSTLVLTLLYTAVPNRKVPVLHALVGAFFVAIMVELAKMGFTLFITLSPTYHLIYGAFAAVPLFLLWVYLSWLMVLLGAVLVRSLDLYGRQGRIDHPHPLISILLILKQLQVKFTSGDGLNFSDVQKRDLPVSLDDWESHTARLMSMGLINKNESGEWILTRDLRQVSLFDFCKELPWPMPLDEELENILFSDEPNWLSELIHRVRTVNHTRVEAFDCSLDELLSKQS